MTAPSEQALRILIGAESAADAAGALRFAKIIAGREPAVFGGLLTLRDDGWLLQSTVQRIVAVSGELLICPDAAGLKTVADSEVRGFRRMMAQMAAGAGLSWTFDVKQGALEHHLATEADVWDITIVGHRALHRRQGSVVVLSSADNGDTLAHRLAEKVADKLNTVVESLALTPEYEDKDALFDRINHMNASAVVLDAATANLGGFERIAELLTVARCPVIILKSASVRSRLQHLVQIPPAPNGR